MIDHHPDRGHTRSVAFLDLREHYGATSTIAACYLQEMEVPIDPKLATVLFYGISAETQHLGREAIPQDILATNFSNLMWTNASWVRFKILPAPENISD